MASGSKIGGRNPVAVHDLRSHLPIADLELWSVIAGISGFDEPSKFARSVPTYCVGGTS